MSKYTNKYKKVNALLAQEQKRQKNTLTLIPSENYAPKAVLELTGSILTNKYTEGYPAKRYYPGSRFYDDIELLAYRNSIKAFGLSPDEWGVNVQAYSGSPANLATLLALAGAGGTIMGLSLAAGGHLTHGHSVSATGIFFKSVSYGVNVDTELIDYDSLEKLAKEHSPKVIISGTTAYPRAIDFARIGAIAKKVGAYHMADISHIAGLVATGLHPSPFPHADVVTSTTHKMLRGPRGAVIFSRTSLSKQIDRAIFPGLQGGPHNNVVAAIAHTMHTASTPAFKKYAKQIIKNNQTLSTTLQKRGFVLTTGGSDNHLFVVDLRTTGLSGADAEALLEKNNILANRNSIPSDTKPFSPSGLRIGTPALTARGMKEKEMVQLADAITTILLLKKSAVKTVATLCKKFPIPKD